MRLEIGNFYVKDIKFGDKLSFDDGVLTINKEKALDFIREDERITEADLYIAKPGDKIRMCPVKEAIEPRVRLDGRGLFPGYTSELAQAGDGTLHALKNCRRRKDPLPEGYEPFGCWKTLGRFPGWIDRHEW